PAVDATGGRGIAPADVDVDWVIVGGGQPIELAAAAALRRDRGGVAGEGAVAVGGQQRVVAGAGLAHAAESVEGFRMEEVAEGDRVDVELVLHADQAALAGTRIADELHDARGVRILRLVADLDVRGAADGAARAPAEDLGTEGRVGQTHRLVAGRV